MIRTTQSICGRPDVSNSAQSLRRLGRSFIGGDGPSLSFSADNANMPVELTRLNRPVSAYLCDNLHYTFAGFNFPPTFLNLLLEIGVSRIMFSADYPYASMTKARAFLEQIPVSTADRALIAHGNAEKLFRI
jgi:predicted TIM-barrel fold metal-dependent hydrolase